MKSKKTLYSAFTIIAATVAFLLFQNMAATNPSTISYQTLSKVNANGACTIRPASGTWPDIFYKAIDTVRTPVTQSLTDLEVLSHAASRLGFGISPIGPLVPGKTNDCTTVFIAHELDRQIRSLGTNVDSAYVKAIRSGLAPLTMFRRQDINQMIVRFNKSPSPQGALWWEANRHIYTLEFVRDFVGSQNVVAGELVDSQINLEDRMAEFWFNHFNVDHAGATQYGYGADSYIQVLRSKIGSTFFALLNAVMHEPAMINYLDNQTNVYNASIQSASNQNLARELLELHTFSTGPKNAQNPSSPYTQADVEVLAKLLAGWNALDYKLIPASGKPVNGFNYNHTLRAPGAITFLGKVFKDTGETRMVQVLSFLANHPTTKKNICYKLSKIFYTTEAYRQMGTSVCVAAWGTNGDLKAIYRALLRRPEFWSRANYRNMYRTPLEVLASSVRLTGFNVIDLHRVVTGEKLTHTVYQPTTMTPEAFTAAITKLNDHTQTKSKFLMNLLEKRYQVLTGTLRGRVADPTGYQNDGDRYFSGYYLNSVSRLGVELTGIIMDATNQKLPSPNKREICSWPYRQFLNTSIAQKGVPAAVSNYIRNVARAGHLPLNTAQRSIIHYVAATPSSWTYWESMASKPREHIEKSIPATLISNSEQLRK